MNGIFNEVKDMFGFSLGIYFWKLLKSRVFLGRKTNYVQLLSDPEILTVLLDKCSFYYFLCAEGFL
jgi:hypothetical protein